MVTSDSSKPAISPDCLLSVNAVVIFIVPDNVVPFIDTFPIIPPATPPVISAYTVISERVISEVDIIPTILFRAFFLFAVFSAYFHRFFVCRDDTAGLGCE